MNTHYCLSNALHSSIGQNIKPVEHGVRCPVSGNNHITTLSFLIGLFLSVCLSTPKRLKVRTSNLAGVFPENSPHMTRDKYFRKVGVVMVT